MNIYFWSAVTLLSRYRNSALPQSQNSIPCSFTDFELKRIFSSLWFDSTTRINDSIQWPNESILCFDSLIRIYDLTLYSTLWIDSMTRFNDSNLWFDSFIRFDDSFLWFDSMIRLYGLTLWFESMIRFYESTLWFDPMIRFYDSSL